MANEINQKCWQMFLFKVSLLLRKHYQCNKQLITSILAELLQETSSTKTAFAAELKFFYKTIYQHFWFVVFINNAYFVTNFLNTSILLSTIVRFCKHLPRNCFNDHSFVDANKVIRCYDRYFE